MFDSATLTDNDGNKTDFRNVIIIMTSNLGTKEAAQVGFTKEETHQSSNAIKDFFAPEFRNRLDAIVHFSALKTEVMVFVVVKLLAQLEEQLKEKNIKIEATNRAKKIFSRKRLL